MDLGCGDPGDDIVFFVQKIDVASGVVGFIFVDSKKKNNSITSYTFFFLNKEYTNVKNLVFFFKYVFY